MIWMIVQPVSMIEPTNKRSRATSNWTIFQPQKKEIESTRRTIFPDIFFFHGNSGKSSLLIEKKFIWLSCYCSRKLSPIDGRFSKWFPSVKKGVLNLSLSMAYNVISWRKSADNTQILKSLNSLCKSGWETSKITKKRPKKTDHSIAISSIFLIGMIWYILDATWWILMSRRFRICLAKWVF